MVSPLVVPDTYARLKKEQSGSSSTSYWDASVVAVFNAFVNVSLALYAISREPNLLSSEARLATVAMVGKRKLL